MSGVVASTAPWIIDLDGVVWNGPHLITGSADAIHQLRSSGHPVWFCTNNSSQTTSAYEAQLDGHGVDGHGRVVSSAHAAAALVRPGERVLCCSGPGVVEAVAAVGGDPVDPRLAVDVGRVDAVVVGFHRDVSFAILRAATRAVLAGARFIATNDDPRFPDGDGLSPGCGAIVAAVERATGARASVAGKPYRPMVELITSLAGTDPGVVVGDSPSTDGALAHALGWRFGLVLSGNTIEADVPAAADPTWVATNLSELVSRHR